MGLASKPKAEAPCGNGGKTGDVHHVRPEAATPLPRQGDKPDKWRFACEECA